MRRFFFFTGAVSSTAGVLTLIFQGLLIVSGNFSWLNFLTLVLCVSCFDDSFLRHLVPITHPVAAPMSFIRQGIVNTLVAVVLILSIHPVLNLISPRKIMNTSFDPLHLVNTYGAFGSITRERMEIIMEGTDDPVITSATQWREYEFKGKPGPIHQMPPQVAPYHLRLDWLMWFAAMSSYRYYPWILNLAAKMLQNDKTVLALIKKNPFPEAPPKYVRAELYHYQFTTPEERRKTGNWWKRTRVEDYLPPLSLENSQYREILKQQGWLESRGTARHTPP